MRKKIEKEIEKTHPISITTQSTPLKDDFVIIQNIQNGNGGIVHPPSTPPASSQRNPRTPQTNSPGLNWETVLPKIIKNWTESNISDTDFRKLNRFSRSLLQLWDQYFNEIFELTKETLFNTNSDKSKQEKALELLREMTSNQREYFTEKLSDIILIVFQLNSYSQSLNIKYLSQEILGNLASGQNLEDTLSTFADIYIRHFLQDNKQNHQNDSDIQNNQNNQNNQNVQNNHNNHNSMDLEKKLLFSYFPTILDHFRLRNIPISANLTQKLTQIILKEMQNANSDIRRLSVESIIVLRLLLKKEEYNQYFTSLNSQQLRLIDMYAKKQALK